MMNYKELKRKEFLFEFINDVIDGMDVYNHNGSLWLIKTEELKWAIEFTKDKILWYNYNLFKNLFKAISLDISENQKYVTEWFESRFLNKPKVWATFNHAIDSNQAVEDTIQNGVKHTQGDQQPFHIDVEDTIENGVRDISPMTQYADWQVEEIIQNGVKETLSTAGKPLRVEDTIQNGVKETISTLRRTLLGVDDIIQNGVKDTGARHLRINRKVDDVIQNGVKEVKHKMAESYQQKDHMVTNAIITEDINYAIENGIKE